MQIPEGRILKPKKPAALSCRPRMPGWIFDLMGCLPGQGAHHELNAAWCSECPRFRYSGFDTSGERYQLFWIDFVGVPGRPAGEGPDSHSKSPAFTNVPNEFPEAYFPLRIRIYASVPGSAGGGWGDPLKCVLAHVLADVEPGPMTETGAPPRRLHRRRNRRYQIHVNPARRNRRQTRRHRSFQLRRHLHRRPEIPRQIRNRRRATQGSGVPQLHESCRMMLLFRLETPGVWGSAPTDDK